MPGNIPQVREGDRPSSGRQNLIAAALRQRDAGPDMVVDELGTSQRPPVFARSKLELVTVAKDGGVAGDDETTCTWTYTVKTLGGITMETGISPQQARYSDTTYLEAGAGGRSKYALAQYVDGTLILVWVAGEKEDPSPCPLGE